MKEEHIPEMKKGCRERQHHEAVEKVQSKVDWVKSLKENGWSIYKISKETGFMRSTINQYLQPDFTPVNGHYGNSRNGLLSPYRAEVITLRSEGKKYKEIADIIHKKGYTGTVDAIRGFIAKERRLQKDLNDNSSENPTELIERKWLIQLLFKPITDVRGISADQFNAVIESYPNAGKLYEAIRAFKKIVFSKKPEKLKDWMESAEALGISEINTFVNGLKTDITAVKNAIRLEYNNGLAEGSVNKIKVIKRIMYGRNKFHLLRNKVLLLENLKIN